MDFSKIEIVQGDITIERVDAVVNAANRTLLGGGGVDGAIHRAAGRELLAECKTLDGCETGDAKITKGYDLPAKHVIHTVGPVYSGGKYGDAEKLASAYRRSIEVAGENNLKSVAFPAISCGVYGYPHEKAAEIALTTIAKTLETYPKIINVHFVLFSDDIYATFVNKLFELKNPD
ncbi:MAG: O-acetyl-ADP-ribose deacetylase [Planctomycetes bacterium]|nr:O-acetyl-ADP-ribose deacetylase [Planctomycetota bacterium]